VKKGRYSSNFKKKRSKRQFQPFDEMIQSETNEDENDKKKAALPIMPNSSYNESPSRKDLECSKEDQLQNQVDVPTEQDENVAKSLTESCEKQSLVIEDASDVSDVCNTDFGIADDEETKIQQSHQTSNPVPQQSGLNQRNPYKKKTRRGGVKTRRNRWLRGRGRGGGSNFNFAGRGENYYNSNYNSQNWARTKNGNVFYYPEQKRKSYSRSRSHSRSRKRSRYSSSSSSDRSYCRRRSRSRRSKSRSSESRHQSKSQTVQSKVVMAQPVPNGELPTS